MTAVHAFPLTPEMRSRIEARESALDLSRTIIRGKERHAEDALRLACDTLMTYGDHFDWTKAYLLLRSLDAPPAASPPATTGRIRRELGQMAGFAVFALLAVFGGLAL